MNLGKISIYTSMFLSSAECSEEFCLSVIRGLCICVSSMFVE